MNEEQRRTESIKCYHEIYKTWQQIQDYSKQYDLICYSYEKQFVDLRFKLKEQIDNGSRKLEFLTLKRSVLLNVKIDLTQVELEDLESYIERENFKQKVKLDNIMNLG